MYRCSAAGRPQDKLRYPIDPYPLLYYRTQSVNTASKKKQKKVGLLYYTLRVLTLYHPGMDLSTHFVESRLTFFTPRVMVTVR